MYTWWSQKIKFIPLIFEETEAYIFVKRKKLFMIMNMIKMKKKRGFVVTLAPLIV